MILQSKGFQIDRFKIPPFHLKEGEIIVLYLGNSIEASRLKEKLFQLLGGKEIHPKLILNEKLVVVERISLKGLKEHLIPTTVKNYVQKKSRTPLKTLEKLNAFEKISTNSKISYLPSTPRKIISLYCTFTKSEKIVFDLSGLDPLGSEKVFNDVLKKINDKKGAAILLDSFLSFKDKCTKFIQVEK